jgi:MATE family multidrug resistance protein
VNFTFAFALRGAGDTWFVSMLTFSLAWPIMVLPTFLVVRYGASVYWAWVFATAHIVAMAACFSFRFRTGKWKAMRVIETVPLDARMRDEG